MSNVVIAGIGQTQAGEHWERSLRSLAVEAIRAALREAGGLKPQALFVGNMLAPKLSNQAHLGALIADNTGLTGIEAITMEASGASGGAALRQATLAVLSGMVDVALVLGVEKFTDRGTPEVEEGLATETDADFEAMQGLTTSGQAALLTQRYRHEYHVPADGFANFALTAHANGAGNPKAMFRKAISAESYKRAEVVCDPLNMFDVAPNADGAAALILTRSALLPHNLRNQAIRVAGSAAASDTLALHDRRDMLMFDTARISAELALEKAGVTPGEVDFFEYQDVFNIYAALQLEAAGFAPRGEGWKLAQQEEIHRQGRIPCATMGGMKARGYTGGAAGVYQAVEAVLQLRGAAGINQVKGARTGLIQCLGGAATTAISHVLTRLE